MKVVYWGILFFFSGSSMRGFLLLSVRVNCFTFATMVLMSSRSWLNGISNTPGSKSVIVPFCCYIPVQDAGKS